MKVKFKAIIILILAFAIALFMIFSISSSFEVSYAVSLKPYRSIIDKNWILAKVVEVDGQTLKTTDYFNVKIELIKAYETENETPTVEKLLIDRNDTSTADVQSGKTYIFAIDKFEIDNEVKQIVLATLNVEDNKIQVQNSAESNLFVELFRRFSREESCAVTFQSGMAIKDFQFLLNSITDVQKQSEAENKAYLEEQKRAAEEATKKAEEEKARIEEEKLKQEKQKNIIWISVLVGMLAISGVSAYLIYKKIKRK